jgi:TFIIF-interacting CTD phosphatase-like protein
MFTGASGRSQSENKIPLLSWISMRKRTEKLMKFYFKSKLHACDWTFK